MEGIAGVLARIQEIQTRFGGGQAGGVLGTDASGANGVQSQPNFAAALAGAQATAQTADPAVPTSSGTLNRAGVDPVRWARDFLTTLHMPVTSENVRAITAWERAEGTAAHFNPLATTQGGFTGETRFNGVGVKNYATYGDGIAANAHALTNGRYGNILAALRAGNSAVNVARAVATSPWGTGQGVLRVLGAQ